MGRVAGLGSLGRMNVTMIKHFLREPARVVWFIAAVIVAQGLVRFAAASHEPIDGEVNPDRVDGMVYLFASAGVASVLIGVGMYLRSRRKDGDAA